jgi:hypothetical protein
LGSTNGYLFALQLKAAEEIKTYLPKNTAVIGQGNERMSEQKMQQKEEA